MLVLAIRLGSFLLIGPVQLTLLSLLSQQEIIIQLQGPPDVRFYGKERTPDQAIALGLEKQILRKYKESVILIIEGLSVEVRVLGIRQRDNKATFGIQESEQINVVREDWLKRHAQTRSNEPQ